MHENSPPASSEHHEENIDLKLLSIQLNDISGCIEVSGYSNMEDAFGHFDDILDKAGYGIDEFAEKQLMLLRIGLMTPGAMASNQPVIEKIKYNRLLQETILANREMKATEFANFLQDAYFLRDPHCASYKSAEISINQLLNGARAELAFRSIIAKIDGFGFAESTPEEDQVGVDLWILVPFGKGKDRTIVKMPADIKSTPQLLQPYIQGDFPKPYGINNNAMVIWCGVDMAELGDNLLPDDSLSEQKSGPMSVVLEHAAIEYATLVRKGKIASDLGRIAEIAS